MPLFALTLSSFQSVHLKYDHLRCCRIETEVRLIVAAADAALYSNGFLPREVLRRIAIEQLDLNKKNINRFSHSVAVPVPVAAAVAPSVAAATAIRVTAMSEDTPGLISVIAVNQPAVTYPQNDIAVDPQQQERAALEIMLNRCLMGTLELSAALTWAGELERRKLCYGDPMRTERCSDHDSCSGGAGRTPMRGSSRTAMSGDAYPRTGDMMFYSTKMFCELLLLMIHEKTERNCSVDGQCD